MGFTAISYLYDTVHLVTRFPIRKGFKGYLSPLSMTCWITMLLGSTLMAFLIHISSSNMPSNAVGFVDSILAPLIYILSGETTRAISKFYQLLHGGKF